MAGLSDFRPNGAGIIQVWKGAEMQAALDEAARELCAQANAAGHVHGEHGDLYEGGVDVLGRTAVGYVTTANHLGRLDQHHHQTLDAINH